MATDVFYYGITIGFLLIAGSVSYLAISAVPVVKSLKLLIDDMEDITRDVQAAKDKVKQVNLGVLSAIVKIISYVRKR